MGSALLPRFGDDDDAVVVVTGRTCLGAVVVGCCFFAHFAF
jgi:hypothetical protein